MLISKTPFRISFMGGRSDFPSFYQEEEGFVVATTIDKYINIQLKKTNENGINYKDYGQFKSLSEVNHPILQWVLSDYNFLEKNTGIELSVKSDIEAGTGLGSSSSFTVGLLNAYKAFYNMKASADQLAKEACDIEINKLGIYAGKQDQYCAAFGGINSYRFLTDGSVEVKPVNILKENKNKLEKSIQVYFTGLKRDAGKILEVERKEQDKVLLRHMKNLAIDFKNCIESNCDTQTLGEILNAGWNYKQKVNPSISNEKINYYYNLGIKSGACGGKLLGAGGGGYLLFVCDLDKQDNLQKALSDLNLFPIQFSTKGSEIIRE